MSDALLVVAEDSSRDAESSSDKVRLRVEQVLRADVGGESAALQSGNRRLRTSWIGILAARRLFRRHHSTRFPIRFARAPLFLFPHAGRAALPSRVGRRRLGRCRHTVGAALRLGRGRRRSAEVLRRQGAGLLPVVPYPGHPFACLGGWVQALLSNQAGGVCIPISRVPDPAPLCAEGEPRIDQRVPPQ